MNDARFTGGTGDLRASDADRERIAEMLRDAAGEGRLDLAELEERLGRTYAAKTYAELVPITADLPEAQAAGRGAPGDSPLSWPGPQEVSAVLSEQKVTGRWLVPRQMTVRALLGQAVLDFTDAAMPHEVVLDVQVGLGALHLVVPDDVAVEFDSGSTILGERKNKTRAVPALGTPRIRVRGLVVLGEVVAKPPKRRWFRR